MIPGWMRARRMTVSHRLLVVVFLAVIVTLAITLRTLFPPHLSTFQHVQSAFSNFPFEITLEIDPDFDLVSGPVISGDIIELEPKSAARPGSHTASKHRPLGKHTLTPDGLLVVNPDGPHPIFQLIRDAEAAWKAKCAKASKTLDEAVAEYKRRYRRAPPLGFDKWWDYVIKHDVQLPDEYDEIYEDIEPFWGIDPAYLALTQQELEGDEGLVTVEKPDTGAHIEIVRHTLSKEREGLLRNVNNILGFVRDVEQDLPPFRFTISPFDNPERLSNWEVKAMALQAAANGTTLTRADMPTLAEAGWIQACPPDSPARTQSLLFSSPSVSATPHFPNSSLKTFIASHEDAMNPCMHPSLLTSHGQFLSYKQGPRPQKTLVPQFSLCATMLHHDIRPPVPYGWSWDVDPGPDEAFEGDVSWEHKVDQRLGWRGRTTGMYASPSSHWAHGHRARLVTFANALEGNVSVLRVPKRRHREDGGGAETVPIGEPETVRLASVNPAWMDVAFTENPIACDEAGGTCDEMEVLWEFRRVQGRQEEGRYKFIIDVDGNGWSGRFKRLITSNALVFKATIYPEWYTSRVAPWVHYVPIQMSYADLHDTVAFFRAHDALAGRIAKAGGDWSRRFWRQQDITAYLYRLILEYARVSSLDRASMDYVG